LFNPLAIATCLARPTSVFTNCAILQAIAKAASGNVINSIFALALASYLSFYPLLLAPPLALLGFDQIRKNPKSSVTTLTFCLSYISTLLIAIGTLLIVSFLITGYSWEFLSSTYGVQILLPDLTPNVGLWWYFFIEMFDSFREFFLGVFWLHMASYVGGLTIRIR